MRIRSALTSVQVKDFYVRGLYTVQNGRAKDPLYTLDREQINSRYGSAELSYQRFLCLNATVQNDWFSVLSPENNSILYPSVSASYIFSENFKPAWLSFGKLRVGYAEAGGSGGVGPASLDLYYQVNANLFNNQPVGGVNRSEEHTSELQSRQYLVCRLLLEKKKL